MHLISWLVGWALIAFPIARVQLAEIALAYHVPGVALRFQPGQARALAGMGTALQLNGQQEQARTDARAALGREPMNVAALRTLGLADEQLGDKAAANRVMLLAARFGWRDSALQLWLMRAYAQAGQYRDALHRADALARTNHLSDGILAVFLAYTRDPRAREALVEAMADRPFWRGLFFYRLLDQPAEEMPYITALVTDLARAGSPITPAERNIYLTKLVQLGQGRAALDYWYRDGRVPTSGQGLIRDGGFDHVPPRGSSVAPFEWQLSPQSATVASVVPAGHGQQLAVSPGHDYSGTLASQTLVLAPGRYRITARVTGDAASAGLRWLMTCVPAQNELAVDTGRDGAGFAAVTVDVPAGDACPAQSLAIDMAPDGDAGGGQVTVDDVAVTRIAS